MVMIGRFCRLAQGFTPQQRLPKRNNTPFQMVLADPVSTLLKSSEEAVLDPLVVCGPSGVGKGTIIAKFMEELGGNELFGFTVSHTTRAPREGESDGIHYHFVDHEYMKHEIAGGGILEFAEVHGNYYGTSWSSLRDVQTGGRCCLLDIDVQGVQNIKTMESDGLKPKHIFIAPPSLQELEERLMGRGTETPESLARRTANARKKLEYGTDTDNNNFDALVVNQNLDLACREFARVVRDLYDL
jgi:guanylate kinase